MIYIIRHGQTEVNHRQALQGRSDFPLNDAGIAQAQTVAEGLKGVSFAHVFTSPLRRAVQTAKMIAPDIQPVVDERLIDFIHNPAPDGMEPLSSVSERAGAFLESIRNLDGNILISTHAIAMKGILEVLTPDAHGSYWSKYIGNCAVYCASHEKGFIPDDWRCPRCKRKKEKFQLIEE